MFYMSFCCLLITFPYTTALYYGTGMSAQKGWQKFKDECGDLFFVDDTRMMPSVIRGCGIQRNEMVWTGNLKLTTDVITLEGCYSVQNASITENFSLQKTSVAHCVYLCKNTCIGLEERKCNCLSTCTLPSKRETDLCKPCSDNEDEICGHNGTYAHYTSGVRKPPLVEQNGLCISAGKGYNNPIKNFSYKYISCSSTEKGLCGNGKTTNNGSWISNTIECLRNGSVMAKAPDFERNKGISGPLDLMINTRKYTCLLPAIEHTEQCLFNIPESSRKVSCQCGYLDNTDSHTVLRYSTTCVGEGRFNFTSFLCNRNVNVSCGTTQLMSTKCNLTSVEESSATLPPSTTKTTLSPYSFNKLTPTPKNVHHEMDIKGTYDLDKFNLTVSSESSVRTYSTNVPLTSTTPIIESIIAGCLSLAVLIFIAGISTVIIYRRRRSRSSVERGTEPGIQMRDAGPISRRPYNDLPLEGSSSPPVYAEVNKRSNSKPCAIEEPAACSNTECLSWRSDVYVASEDDEYDHLGARRMRSNEDDGTNEYSLGFKPQGLTESDYNSQSTANYSEDEYDHVGERGMKAHEDDDTNEYSLGRKPEDHTEEGEYNSPIPTYLNTHLNDGSNVYDTATNF